MKAGKRHEVLLVEDNPGDVGLMREAFKLVNTPITLHVAPDGEKAMEFLKREGPNKSASVPDLVLLDLNLPKKDGREVLKTIKMDDNLKSIPVLIVTTSRSKEDVHFCYQHHANGYLIKSGDFDEVMELGQAIDHFWFTANVGPC